MFKSNYNQWKMPEISQLYNQTFSQPFFLFTPNFVFFPGNQEAFKVIFEVQVGEYSYSGQKHLINMVNKENTWNSRLPALYLTLDGVGRKSGLMTVSSPCLE